MENYLKHSGNYALETRISTYGLEENNMCIEEIKKNQKKIIDLWNGIINMLPPQPRSYDTSDDPGFWTNGEEILCPSEAEMEMVYEFLNDIFSEFGNYTLITWSCVKI